MRLLVVLLHIQLCFIASAAQGISFKPKASQTTLTSEDWWIAAKKAVERGVHQESTFQQSLAQNTEAFLITRRSQPLKLELPPDSPIDWLKRFKIFSFLNENSNVTLGAVNIESMDEAIHFISELTPYRQLRYAIFLRATWDESLLKDGLYNLTDESLWTARSIVLYHIPPHDIANPRVRETMELIFTPTHLSNLFERGARAIDQLAYPEEFYQTLLQNALQLLEKEEHVEERFMLLAQIYTSNIWQKHFAPDSVKPHLLQLLAKDPSLWARMKLRFAASINDTAQGQAYASLFASFPIPEPIASPPKRPLWRQVCDRLFSGAKGEKK